jgi:hypothetical protein
MMHYVKSGEREEQDNWNIWHKEIQELNPNASQNYLLYSIIVCVSPLISSYCHDQ